jgi:hypothetical protein
VICGLAWGFVFFLVAMVVLGNYAENYYVARVARGGDPTFGDIGETWIMGTVTCGLIGFALGALGLLPGTRQK